MATHAKSVDDEGQFVSDNRVEDPIAEAHRLHHLATADPEPERDGVLLSVEHEEKYGLERKSDLSVPESAVEQRKLQNAAAPRVSDTKK